MTKVYDKQLANKTDKPAKNIWINYLNNVLFKGENLISLENGNDYGIDILTVSSEDNNVHFAWEVEVRIDNWVGDKPFRFPTVNCLCRKDKWWEKKPELFQLVKKPYVINKDTVLFYVQFNNLLNRVIVIPGDTILKYEPVYRWNKYVNDKDKDNGWIREVPVEYVEEFKLKAPVV